MPARRTDHPLKTLFLLGLLATVSWAAYEQVYVRRIFGGTGGFEQVDGDRRDRIRDAILQTFGNDDCFEELGPLQYRYKEGQYRIDLVVSEVCVDDARGLCERVADLLQDDFSVKAGVFAFDGVGREVARYVP